MTKDRLIAIRKRDQFYLSLSHAARDIHFPTGKSIVAAEDRHDLLEYIDELQRRLEQTSNRDIQDMGDAGSRGTEQT